MGRKVDENKKELAYLLYMKEETNKSIAERLGISEKTVGNWADTQGWKEKRNAVKVSRPELINSLLKKLAEQLSLDKISADEVSKITTSIEKLDKEGTNLFSYINVFMEFGNWAKKLIDNGEIMDDDLKLIVRLQDRFIQEKL